MAVRATVLYDAPGPKGRRNNRLYSVIAGLIFLAIIGWVAWTLNNNGQFEGRLWTPFLQSQTWTTYLLPGLRGTLFSAFASIVLACIFGVVLGLGRLSESRFVRWICGIIVEFFRAIPVLLLMIFAYQLFAVYDLVPSQQLAFSAVVFALTLYNGSVIAEILRSGIRSLPKGQTEAAKALGLSHRLTMYRVLLPQAIASMLPALIAQMVIALKDSALGYQIGYVEIVRSGIPHDNSPKNEQNNVAQNCKVLAYDSTGNIFAVRDSEKLVVAHGLKDYIVADAGDVLLICPKSEEQRIKQMVNDVKIAYLDKYL